MSGIACGSNLQGIEPSSSFHKNMERIQNSKPPLSQTSSSRANSLYAPEPSRTYSSDSLYPSKLPKAVSRDSRDEYDHQTFATATTASGTISYSHDEMNSVASEAGMEVVMSSKGSEFEIGEHESYRSHSFAAGKHTFTVDTRYSMDRVVGSGAYGVVISAEDSKTQEKAAIKMVPKAFNDEIDAKRILREIKLLKHFNHENVIQIVDMMPPTASYVEDFHDVYIVAELMETDLHRIIYSKQKLSIDHARYFTYQILRGLKYIHSAEVIHRDLKPSNLLVNSNCDLKICDFGLARGINPDECRDRGGTMLLTEYVVTRWYRAPEIMLACHEYSKPVDVWSVGCIFAELILRKPYFPGDDYIDQLTIISEKLGKLPESKLDFVTSEKARRFMRKLPNKPHVTFSTQFPGTPSDALDLLRCMLDIHPRYRIDVCSALEHPFMEELYNPKDEPVAESPFDFSFEREKLHRTRLQELIWKEAGHFRPSCLPVAPQRGDSVFHRKRDP